MTSGSKVPAVFRQALKRWEFRNSGYSKYGLRYDDLYHDFNPIVEEAIRRLPDDIYFERCHRIFRALDASTKKSFLPKDFWTSEEENANHYLKPYIDEVVAEKKEKEEWNNR